MAGTLIVPVVDEGLGNSAYLVDLGTAGPTVTGAGRRRCGGPGRPDPAGVGHPGHTAEHLAYLLLDGRSCWGLTVVIRMCETRPARPERHPRPLGGNAAHSDGLGCSTGRPAAHHA